MEVMGGRASVDGFCITVKKRCLEACFSTCDFSEIEEEKIADKLKKYIKIAIVVYVFLLWMLKLEYSFFPDWWFADVAMFFFFLLSFRLALALSFLFCGCLIEEENTWQWHSCEHKVANLLNNNREIIMENLKKEDAYISGCGSNFILKQIFSLFFIMYFIPFFFLFFSFCFLTVLFCIFSFVFLLFLLEKSGLARLCQYAFCLREPSEKQYKEALILAKDIEKWNKSRL